MADRGPSGRAETTAFMRVEITDEMVERAARGLYDHHIETGGEVVAEWENGAAEFMRHIFREQARAAIEAAFDRVEKHVYVVLLDG